MGLDQSNLVRPRMTRLNSCSRPIYTGLSSKAAWHEAWETLPPMGPFKKKNMDKRERREKRAVWEIEKEKYDLFSMFTVYFFLESILIF